MRSKLNLIIVKEAITRGSVRLHVYSYTISFCFFLEEPLNDSIVSDDEEEEEDEEVSLKAFWHLLEKSLTF